MKKQLNRLITVVLLALSILAITQMAVYAQEETQNETQEKLEVSLLKTSEESYIIYVEDTINTEFLFSFSENNEANEEDLIFSASGLDSNESNVAYMTKELAESFTDGKAYMWVQIDDELTTYEINLNQAVTNAEIEFVNTTTKRIEVGTDGSEKTSEDVEGVKITHSQGKVTITEEGEAFSYYMVKVEDEQTTKFVELASQIMTSEELSNYERITLVRQFTDTYTEMFEEIEEWEEVASNKEILQPHESEKGDIYIVWIKNDETGEHDVQILVCDDGQNIEVEEAKKVIVYDVTKLPVTYDSIITLIIVLVVIVAIIIALVVAKKKLNKKED